jgi:hypothetical protein
MHIVRILRRCDRSASAPGSGTTGAAPLPKHVDVEAGDAITAHAPITRLMRLSAPMPKEDFF